MSFHKIRQNLLYHLLELDLDSGILTTTTNLSRKTKVVLVVHTMPCNGPNYSTILDRLDLVLELIKKIYQVNKTRGGKVFTRLTKFSMTHFINNLEDVVNWFFGIGVIFCSHWSTSSAQFREYFAYESIQTWKVFPKSGYCSCSMTYYLCLFETTMGDRVDHAVINRFLNTTKTRVNVLLEGNV